MLLALDTATEFVSVALHDGERVVAEQTSTAAMKHGEQLAPLIEAVMAQAGSTRRDLTAIGAGVGPGPFTGLRVGLVTARTLAMVLELPVYGVCTLDVIAAEVSARVDEPFLVATDARRKEVYLASYAEGVRVEGPVVTKPAEVATDLPVAGKGPVLYPEAFPHALPIVQPSAGWLAHVITSEAAELLDPEPLYLRRPDAVAPGKPKPVS
ncbi:MAG: tRNA (adenosine(37)-N6)-threonylcarbamoyltransferase complex dimerization subunit type 1 TsaB [Nocardioides sp.]